MFIIAALTLFNCFDLLAENERSSVAIENEEVWAYPDHFVPKAVARMPHPARNIYDFKLEPVDTCGSVRLADVLQSANDFCNNQDWDWRPLGISDCGEDKILYCLYSDFYISAVYAYLNPGQKGMPSALLIVAGLNNDPWPLVWFEMDEEGISLYSGEWGEGGMIIKCIEKYEIENGAFKVVSIQQANEIFDCDLDDRYGFFRSLLK